MELHNHDLGETHHLRVSFSKSTIWVPVGLHQLPPFQKSHFKKQLK